METNKRKKTVLMLCTCMLLVIGTTACGTKSDVSQINAGDIISNDDTESKTDEQEKVDTETGGQSTEEKQTTSTGETSASLFANANLQGSVVEFSDSEISLSIATITTDENGGEVMAEAAPGMEEQDELVHVTYGENVTIQILTMDSASQTQVSLTDADKSSVKKQTSVLIFGSCQDTYHWTADKVVIVRWQ